MIKNYKFKLRSALAVIMCSISMGAFAQLPMTRSTFTSAYNPITIGGGAILSTVAGDDATQLAVPIGFTFNYLGINYTTLDICSNGWASFGAGGSSSFTNSGLFTATTPNNTLAPWWDDLNVGTGSILYQTEGTPGSQTFTVQWSNVSSYNGGARTITFKLVLFEGTNVIEFHYDSNTPGAYSTTESASIGIEGAVGGAGNFIDAMSGSSFINQSYMNTTKWLSDFIRFTPGAPSAMPSGTYTVGAAGNFLNLNEAVANINHRGIAGPVTLSLTDALYDTTVSGGKNIFPLMLGPVAGNSSVNTITVQPASGTATLSYRGVVSGSGGNQANATAYSATSEPIFALVGADFVTVRNLNLQTTAVSGLVDRGLLVSNATAVNGAQNNLFENISIILSRTYTSTIGIQQNVFTIPTTAAGSNSNNSYRNLSISNSYAGIYLLGNATFPDLGCVIGNTSPTTFNLIGGATANDIGNGTAASYGIRCANQNGVQVYNNEVRNISTNAAVACDGILMELTQGNADVYRNKVHDIRNNSTTATSNVNGIRANIATTASHNLRVYNNFIYGLTSAYAGASVATRQYRGIYAQAAGGGVATSSISVDNNSVYINGSSNISSACFEIGTSSGPVMNVRNNIFSNNTAAQTAPAAHYAWVSTSATLTGNTGSVSNNNDLYVANATQGFVGLGNATAYAALANWQTAMAGQDVNSISSDPSFASSSDLHVGGVSLDGAALPLAWITTDIDDQVRSATTPDIGADEFTPALLDAGVSALVAPVAGACFSNAQQVTVQLKNYGVSPLDFSVNNVTITVNVTGAITTTLNITLSDNSINGGAPVAVGGAINVPVGTFNMSTVGTYTFNSFASLSGDANGINDAMSAVNISYQPGSVAASVSNVCQGSTVALTLTGNTASTIIWEMSTDGGTTWNPIAGATTSPYIHTPTDTTVYRTVMCGSLISTNVDTVIYNPVFAPTTVNDTVCGIGSVTLGASGLGTLNWYSAATGGAIINTGSTYTTNVSVNTTYYVESVNGGTQSSVGLFDNTVGSGGQQTSTNYNIFDVFQNSTLIGAYVYPGAAGNVVCDLLDNAGVLITSRTVAVSAGDVNQRTYISLNIPLTPGTGYRLAQGVGSVSLFRNNSGVNYPYTIPGSISITGSAAGGSFYYWFYSLQVTTGCSSPRVPVDAIVVPTASINVTATSSAICEGDSTSLSVISSNLGYAYSWSSNASLSDSVGSSVSAFPTTTTSYVVTADSAGCIAKDTVIVTVNPLPLELISMSDSIICVGQNDTLIASISSLSGVPIASTVVPVGIIDNTTVSSNIVIPVSSIINPSMNMQVCLDATHTWNSDMNITLTSPTGTVLNLSSGNGGAGDNYTNTCFSMSAGTNIVAGTPPFTGTFIPQGAGGFDVFNGENTSGTWLLSIQDVAAGDQGSLNSWSISFSNNYALSWTSNPAGFSSTNDSIFVSPAITTDYILTVTDTATGCINTYTNTVYVRQPLSVTLTADSLICLGDTSFISAAALGGDGNYVYNWSNGVTTAIDTASPVISTQYTLTLSDGCGSSAVVDSFMVNVATPLVITGITNDSTVCANTAMVLNISTTGGDGNNTYLWSDGATTATDSITTATTGLAITYSVSVTDGCANAVVDSVVITTYGATTASILTSDTSICSGDTVIALLSAGGGDGNLTYNWSNGVTTANDTTVSTTTTTYIVTVADGCANTAVDSITITVYSPLLLTVSADTTICYGDSVNLLATVLGGDGNYNYSWSNGEITASNIVGPALTTPYGILVNDGCYSVSDTINISVNQYPIVNLGSDTTQCAGTVVLDADNTGASFSWSNTATSQTITVTTSGQYSVAVTNSGCTTNDTIDVTINLLPAVGLSPFTTPICNDLTAYALTNGNPAGGVYSGSNVTGSAFNSVAAGVGVHPITYTITDTNGCSNSSTQNITVQSCTGIDELNAYEVVVYPNPTSGVFTIAIKNANIDELIISVVDIQGKEVFGSRESNITADYNKQVNLEGLSKGMYYIKLSTGADVKIQKLIVQ